MWFSQCAPCHNNHTYLIHCFTPRGAIPGKSHVDTICSILQSHWRAIILAVPLYFPDLGHQNSEQAVKSCSKPVHQAEVGPVSSVVPGSGPCTQWVINQWLLFSFLLSSPLLPSGQDSHYPSIRLAYAYYKVTVYISSFSHILNQSWSPLLSS